MLLPLRSLSPCGLLVAVSLLAAPACRRGPADQGLGGGGGPEVDGGAGADGGGNAFVGCPGLSVQQEGVLDIDLRAVSISGNVTLNRAPLPNEAASRGRLLFRLHGHGGQTSASVELGATGAKRYSLRLPPGTYDVLFVPNLTVCASATPGAMPCGGGVLHRNLPVSADGVLDIDVPVVAATGRVTLRGAALPDQPRERGALRFTTTDGVAATTRAFGTTGPISYRINLLPGRYDLEWNGNPAGCALDVPADVPCNSGKLREELSVDGAGVIDVDLPVVRVSGSVTLNGAALPAAAMNRGALTFGLTNGAVVSARPFGTTGAASFGLAILPGRYAISFSATAALCGPTQVPEIPCLGGTLLASHDLLSDGVLPLDIRAVTVSGAVTLQGGPLPAESGDRGAFLFTNRAGGGGATPSLGTSGAGSYRIRIIAGTYDVDYVSNARLCAVAGVRPQVPCTGARVASEVALTSDGVMDIDLRRVVISGAVIAWGAELPAAGTARGSLTFSRPGGSAVTTAPFSPSGPAAFALSLWPGVYDVTWTANTALCGPGLPAPVVPCVGGMLRAGAALVSDGVLDLEIRPIAITGSVTVNGSPLPAATVTHGSLGFTRSASEGGGSVPLPLGMAAAPRYAVTLTAGNYVIHHAANAATCDGGGVPVVPCASQVVHGCF